MQKVWNKVRQLQDVTGFTKYSPIWGNNYYNELKKLHYGAKWQQYGITLLSHIFENGKLCSFHILQTRFQLPRSMQLYYMQLQHAVRAQTKQEPWVPFPTLIFNYMAEVEIYKGFISRSYYMLLLRLAGNRMWEHSRMNNGRWFYRQYRCVPLMLHRDYHNCTSYLGPISRQRGSQHGDERGPYMF